MLQILSETLKMKESAKDNKGIHSELNWKSIISAILPHFVFLSHFAQ
jgi:hypothetical protein